MKESEFSRYDRPFIAVFKVWDEKQVLHQDQKLGCDFYWDLSAGVWRLLNQPTSDAVLSESNAKSRIRVTVHLSRQQVFLWRVRYD